MKPVYISVDCEFTDGDLHQGQLMQLGLVNVETEAVWSSILPITTEAHVNAWVKSNLPQLVSAALQSAVFGAPVERYAHSAKDWVQKQQSDVYWSEVGLPDDGISDPSKIAEAYPAVLVAYCGGYDFGFTTGLFNRASIPSPFHYEMVEISSLALGLFPAELEWGFTAAELEALLGMEPNERAHDALADAKHQAEMFRRLMKLRKEK